MFSSNNERRSLDPLPWNDFYAQELYLEAQRGKDKMVHHAYFTAPLGKGPLFVMHHGAGASGLSFALLASKIRNALTSAGILSVDARAHGETAVSREGVAISGHQLNLSLEILSQDLIDVLSLIKQRFRWPEYPGLILIGHSLGGAVVTDIAASGKLGNAVLGYCVLDVVEGSAIDALRSMQTYLSTRPKSFPTLSSGIEWQ